MFCAKCGTQLTEGAKFCGKCGSNVDSALNEASEQIEMAASVDPGTPAPPIAQNEYVTQGKEVSKQYWSFFLSSLKAPFFHAKGINQAGLSNSLISFILLSLFVPLTSYFSLRNLHPYMSPPFGTTVITPFIVLLISLFVVTGVIFVSLKLMQVNADFKVLMNRLSSLIAVPILLSFAGMVFTILSANILGYIVLTVALVILPLSLYATIFSYDKTENKGLDSFYGNIVTLIGLGIISVVVFFVVLETVFNQISNQLYWF